MSIVTHRLRSPVHSALTENSAPLEKNAELSRHIAVHEVFLDIAQTFGTSFVPDLFIGMAARPAYLEAAWELFSQDLNLQRYDRRTKQIIALAITTDEAGTYCIAAYPHAFRLNALDEAMCDKIVSALRFFRTFDRFLSEVGPSHFFR